MSQMEWHEKAVKGLIVFSALGIIGASIYLGGTSRWRRVHGGEVDALDARLRTLEERVRALEAERPEKRR